MPKGKLIEPFRTLEDELINSLRAGLKEFRPDLHYPESHSDMQACVRGVLQMFDIERRALPRVLEYHCDICHNEGEIKFRPNPEKEPNSWHTQPCQCQDKR